ncbi:MAG: hypothetical protein AAF411_07235 [Myxococcota bacterium]
MKRYALLGLALACTSNGALSVTGTDAIAGATSLEVRALRAGSCADITTPTNAANADAIATLRADFGESLTGQLPNERHVAYALLFDAQCNVVGIGCTNARPGNDVRIEVSATPTVDVGYVPSGGACVRGTEPLDMGIVELGADVAADLGDVDDLRVEDANPSDTGPDEEIDMRTCASLDGCGPLARGNDADSDGVRDEFECDLDGADPCCPDSDMDGLADACDVDSDNDGALDSEECPALVGDCVPSRDPADMRCGETSADFLDPATCGSCTVACPNLTPESTCRRVSPTFDNSALCAQDEVVTVRVSQQQGPVVSAASYTLLLVPLAANTADALDPTDIAQFGSAAIEAARSGATTDTPTTIRVDDVIASLEQFGSSTFARCEGSDAQPSCITTLAIVIRIGEDTCRALGRTVVVAPRGNRGHSPVLFGNVEPGVYLYNNPPAATGPSLAPASVNPIRILVEGDDRCPDMVLASF